MSKWLKNLAIFIFCFQLVSCGTILYPERRGQKAGRLDVGVVLLDGLGLLFFLIPGVIAFAVDFATGTIYLPFFKDSKARYDLAKPGSLRLMPLDEHLVQLREGTQIRTRLKNSLY